MQFAEDMFIDRTNKGRGTRYALTNSYATLLCGIG